MNNYQDLLDWFAEEERKRKRAPTHRMRRGKLVPIPDEWQGRVARPQTQRKRRQEATAKRKERRRGLRVDKRRAMLEARQELNVSSELTVQNLA